MFFHMNRYKRTTRSVSVLSAILLISHSVKAEGPPPPSSISNPFVVTMLIIIVILALAIGILANVVMGAAFVQTEKEKETGEKKVTTSVASTAALTLGLLFLSLPGLAQDKAAAAAPAVAGLVDGISPTAFYMIAGVIFVELMVVLVLLYNLRLLLNIERKKKVAIDAAVVVEKKPRISLWDRFNKFRPIEQEVDIDLGHNYDGIRELDNRLPPWWLYGFYACIIFACVYLWRYHVSHTAPLSGEEYQIAMQEAAVQKEAYLKKAANNIDETNVKFLGGASNLAAGKGIFESICAACHGKEGQGIVGPNLTDNYWIHGGTINDIFKTIKYGYPDKGMKSWKDDYSPSQIADLASYIITLHGTNPPNPKAPQGILFTGQTNPSAPASDSASNNIDSAKRTALR
jgi:cytochrome c oxidase cbb3-type subunit 3